MAEWLSIDFETASTADLRRTGAYIYARHRDTRVLCMAWAFDDDPVQVWREGQPFPQAVLNHIAIGGKVRAFNAAFEWNIYNFTLPRQIGPGHGLSLDQLHDTMAAAAYWGLPLSLDAAAPAAGLGVKKDKEGHALMMRMSRPRAVDKASGRALSWWHEDDPDRFDRLCDYCATDVQVERALAYAIPPLPPAERQVWLLDQRMNGRGIGVDLALVDKLDQLAREAVEAAGAELQALSAPSGRTILSVNATTEMLRQVQALGSPIENLQRGTVDARLADPACWGLERQILQIRSDAARASAAKLNSMRAAAEPDAPPADTGLVRGMLQYYGAFRTGRWAGRLIQLQNLPRGTLQDAAAAIRLIQAGAGVALVEALFGPAMAVVSSCLRGCITAPPGYEIVSVDFAQIEARVLAWLAGQLDLLAVFARGEDVYIRAASGIYVVPEDQVTKPQRQIGKVSVLALGYGGGIGAFQTMAAAYGVAITDEEANKIKLAWRAANPQIVEFWWDLDNAARDAIEAPGQHVACGQVTFAMWGRHLVCRLPSGRCLVYRDAEIVPGDRPGRTEISYMGVDQYTRKWTRIRTYGGKLAENITQAVARDLMADAMLRADRAGHDLRLTVHDELIAVAPAGQGAATCDAITTIMRTVPAWAAGLPCDADGWHGDRYRK